MLNGSACGEGGVEWDYSVLAVAVRGWSIQQASKYFIHFSSEGKNEWMKGFYLPFDHSHDTTRIVALPLGMLLLLISQTSFFFGLRNSLATTSPIDSPWGGVLITYAAEQGRKQINVNSVVEVISRSALLSVLLLLPGNSNLNTHNQLLDELHMQSTFLLLLHLAGRRILRKGTNDNGTLSWTANTPK